jgi:hypothetical protein
VAARLLATASEDATVRLWDAATADCLLTVPVHHTAQVVVWIDRRLAIGLSSGILVIDLNLDVLLYRSPSGLAIRTRIRFQVGAREGREHNGEHHRSRVGRCGYG